MSDPALRFEIAIWWWWPLAWIAVGLSLYIPLSYLAHTKVYRPGPFWSALWRSVKRKPWNPIVVAVLWPWAVWEEIR
jgi:hypothetical protein